MHDDMQPDTLNAGPAGAHQDQEGAMARADLYKLANYSLKLFKKLDDSAQLEGWVQAKITKAADYIASVYHYLEYEMKFNEYGEHLANAEVMSEGQKQVIKNKLMEAKQKMAELKKLQADKISGKSVKEGVLSGGERPCAECGGSGMVYEEPKAIPDHVKTKVDKYKRLTKAMHAANKRLDKNHNGIPDNLENDQEVGEDQAGLKKSGDSYKTAAGGTVTKTPTGIKHTRDPNSFDDGGDELDSMSKSGKGKKSHAKAQSAAEKKDRAPAQKMSKSGTWGMKDGAKFDNRKKEKAVDETFGQGVYAEGKKANKDYDGDGKVESDKDEVWGSRAKAAAKAGKPFGKDKKVAETLKGKQHKLDVDDDGDIEADDLADLRSGKKKSEKKVDEAKKKTMSQAAKGNEKYGKDGMKELAKAGREGASKKKMDAIRDKHDNYSESWKNKARALQENLESLVSEADDQNEQALMALVQRANEMDPTGLKQAQAQGPAAIQQFLTGVLQKIEATVDSGAQPGQQAGQAATMGQEPKDQPNAGDTTSAEAQKNSAANNALKGLSGAAAIYFGGSAAKQALKMATDKPTDPNAPQGAAPAPASPASAAAPARESVEFNRMKELMTRLNG